MIKMYVKSPKEKKHEGSIDLRGVNGCAYQVTQLVKEFVEAYDRYDTIHDFNVTVSPNIFRDKVLDYWIEQSPKEVLQVYE